LVERSGRRGSNSRPSAWEADAKRTFCRRNAADGNTNGNTRPSSDPPLLPMTSTWRQDHESDDWRLRQAQEGVREPRRPRLQLHAHVPGQGADGARGLDEDEDVPDESCREGLEG